MKLLRYGLPGMEQPALLDAEGRIRSLVGKIKDWAGNNLLPDKLAEIAAIDPHTLP